MKSKSINRQLPVFEYDLPVSGDHCTVYEEFGFYTIYINGRMCSSHESLERAKRKIAYLDDKELDRASDKPE